MCPAEFAISSNNLTHRFGRSVVVDQIDLAVPKGSITAFLGPNGAGKTTTIRLLLGLLKATHGYCEVLGYPPGHPKALGKLGALVEHPSLYDHLTGRENMKITCLMKDAPSPQITDVLSQVGLIKDANRLVRTYSLGMRQRLGLALALLGSPDLLILDEPNNGLDPAGILEMRELIRTLSLQRGVTVFLSSHLLAEVEQVAAQVVVIDHGQLRYQGPTDKMGGLQGDELIIFTNNPESASSHLSFQGFQARVRNGAVCVASTRDDAPRIINSLVSAGFSIYEASTRHDNLEARFLSLLKSS